MTADALGCTVTVQEYTGMYPSATLLDTSTYTYDLQDRLITIQDAAGHATTIGYDSLGRKTSLVDPDLGRWQYLYPSAPTPPNPLWLVAQQIDAKAQALSYQYDALDRLTSKSGPNLKVGYTYDTGPGSNLVGRRASMQDQTQNPPAWTASYSYDQRGRLTSVSRWITGIPNPYQFAMTYDAQDRPLTLTYPNDDVLSYVYGDHGKPISALLNGAPLVLNASYNALLKPTVLPLGNGLQTVWKYYGSNLDVIYSQGDQNKSPPTWIRQARVIPGKIQRNTLWGDFP